MNSNPFISNLPGVKPARKLQDRRTAGATLTEVLITVLILSIGMLTAARLLNDSLQLLGDSRFQQRAMRLAADLTELLSNTHASLASDASTPANHNCERSLCNPQQFLQHNLQYWHERAAQLLPGGRISVELQTASEATVAEITVRWTPRGSNFASLRTQTMLLPNP